MIERHLARLVLATSRKWGYGRDFTPAADAYLTKHMKRFHDAERRRKDGRRIWWPRSAGTCCSEKHGFSRSPIAQVEGSLFQNRRPRREPIVPFRRWRLDEDLPF